MSEDKSEVVIKGKSTSGVKSYILKNNLLPYKCVGKNCLIKHVPVENLKFSLHLDHIDGNSRNNRLSNLRFLCPNCHAETDTYCGKNSDSFYSTTNKKVEDWELVEALRSEKNISDALKAVGLSGGTNYKRCDRLILRYSIEHLLPAPTFTKIDYCKNERCKKAFAVDRNTKKYCSKECLIESLRQGSIRPVGSSQSCPSCGEDFIVKINNQKYCDNQCSRKTSGKLQIIPSKETLLQELNTKLSIIKLSKKYGVSDSNYRKWCKKKGLDPSVEGRNKIRSSMAEFR